MRRVWRLAPLLVLACDKPTPTPPASPDADATVTTADETRAKTTAPAAGIDWAFLGAEDPTLAQTLRDEQAVLEKYLVAESSAGELHVADADVEALLAYAGPLLEAHVGKAGKSTLEDDGQRYLQAAWLTRHAKLAAGHHASQIRIPISACVGWGCEVPSEFVAADCFGPVAFFVTPRGADLRGCEACFAEDDDDKRLDCMSEQCNFVAEGHFTGASQGVESDAGEGAEDVGCGKAWEFEITRIVEDSGFTLVAPAGGPPPT